MKLKFRNWLKFFLFCGANIIATLKCQLRQVQSNNQVKKTGSLMLVRDIPGNSSMEPRATVLPLSP